MRVAAAAYPMEALDNWPDYESKMLRWVSEAAQNGAELLVFPEYAALELAALQGRAVAGDLEKSLRAVDEILPQVDALHAALAQIYDLHILAASAPVFDPATAPRPVNCARLFTPTGQMAAQDKQIMTRFERDPWNVVPGSGLRVFDTALGKIAILICYDAEFPLLGRAVAEADVILVPSCTDSLQGYHRVRIGAQARALENQCVTVMASTVGACDWSSAVDENIGAGGVFGPPDTGFAEDGVLALGGLNTPGWTYADVDLDKIKQVRTQGAQQNRAHWNDQKGRKKPATVTQLR